MADLESGESGRVVDPSQLARPAMWPEPPPGQAPVPIRGRAEEPEKAKDAQSKEKRAYAAVAMMAAALVLLAVMAITRRWEIAFVALPLGGAGVLLAMKAHVMEDATVGEDVSG
ncbi:MAG: DUF4337 family protein [Mycobacteriales bacterium]